MKPICRTCEGSGQLMYRDGLRPCIDCCGERYKTTPKQRMTEKELNAVTRRGKTLEFVTNYLKKYNAPPTYEQIRIAIGAKSASTVVWHMKWLEQHGYIVRKNLRVLKEWDGYL